jgi:hypothetical protein
MSTNKERAPLLEEENNLGLNYENSRGGEGGENERTILAREKSH